MRVYICKNPRVSFIVKVGYQKAYGIVKGVVIILAIIALALGAVCFCTLLSYKHVTIEAGEQISAYDVVGIEGAYFGNDFSPDCVNHAGQYEFTVITGNEKVKVLLNVRDTHAPVVKVKNIKFAIGTEHPTPYDFIDTIYEPDDYKGEFLTPMPHDEAVGAIKMKIRFTDASGNQTQIFDVEMIKEHDNEPPKITLNSEIISYVGEGIAYGEYISVSDNCIGDLRLEFDDSEVDYTKEGKYKVHVTAYDLVGNKSKQSFRVEIVEDEVTEDELRIKIGGIANSITSKWKTKEQICRDIYAYVKNNIEYTGISRSRDCVSEAYRALFVSGDGDCYSYFAAAKALFDYFGIENLDVKRSEDLTDDTHYWSIVNIGDEKHERWYHIDCTRLRDDKYNHSGCLLTNKQIYAYNTVRPYFYSYNSDEYPTISNKIITQTPNLEIFYN